MNRIVHFEIQATDPEKVAAFYRKVFGWEIKKWESPMMEYWMVMTAPQDSKEQGINGGLLRRNAAGVTPAAGCSPNAFVCTVQVDDIDATIKAVVAAGGTEQMPKFEIAGMAWQAYFKDTDGNLFGLHQVIRK